MEMLGDPAAVVSVYVVVYVAKPLITLEFSALRKPLAVYVPAAVTVATELPKHTDWLLAEILSVAFPIVKEVAAELATP